MNPRQLRTAWQRRFNPTPTDLATRAWRTARPIPSPSDTPIVIFCAPLMGRHMADDWSNISRGVARMVRSLQAQTDSNWRLVITGQDAPDGWPDDPRCLFMPFDEPVEGMDKDPKIAALIRALPDQLAGQDGYMHALDADDVVHPGLVAHIRADNNGRGYWHRLGGMIDAQTGEIAPCGPRSLRRPTSRVFLAQCGTCAAIYVDFRNGDTYQPFAERFYISGHRNFRIIAAVHGVQLDPIPFPAALYVMNTGENMRQKRGKMDNKLGYLRRNRLSDAEQSAWRDDFGWSG